MREQLIQYVELLFAGAPDSTEIKQEILQNTLDRFDDLVEQGKSPEAAYRLAISGIGDINEILGSAPQYNAPAPTQNVRSAIHAEMNDVRKKNLRAVAIALYICCVIPVIALSSLGNGGLGVCLMFLMIAAATAILIMTDDKDDEDTEKKAKNFSPKQELKKSIDKFIGAITLAVYLIISFLSGAWHITWLIFPISACVKGLINAIIDLREACKHEN